jgi:hypothetical protein
MRQRPITFVLDSCSLKRLANWSNRDEVERLQKSTLDGDLVHLVGHALLPELWGMLKDPANMASFEKQANQIMLLKTHQKATPCWVIPWFKSLYKRIDLELLNGNCLPLRKATFEGSGWAVKTYRAVRDPAIRQELVDQADDWKSKDKLEEDSHKQVVAGLLKATPNIPPPSNAQFAPVAVSNCKKAFGIDKNPQRFLTIWAMVSFSVYLFRRETIHQTPSPLHRSDAQYFYDATYADILVTNDGERGKPTGLLNRVREMKKLGLAKRPHFVVTLEEFLAWFLKWTPGKLPAPTPDGNLPP